MASQQQLLRLQNEIRPNGRIFEVERAAAEHSGLIRMVLVDFPQEDLAQTVIPIRHDVSDDSLARVFEWATYWKDQAKADDDGHKTAVRWWKPLNEMPWDRAFLQRISGDTLCDVLRAANYLDILPLYELGCQYLAGMIRGKEVDEIREIFSITNDFTPEEEAAVRRETAWAYAPVDDSARWVRNTAARPTRLLFSRANY